jgi:plasmid stabilization system protein ParE
LAAQADEVRTVFHHLAWEELVEAYSSYDSESPDDGRNFACAMHEALQNIASSPLRYPVHIGEARRCLILRFKHAVIFRVLPDHIFIIAVMHTRRSPGYWRGRVTKK